MSEYWTPKEIHTLETMARSGESTSSIAKAIGRTPLAVRVKRRRIGMSRPRQGSYQREPSDLVRRIGVDIARALGSGPMSSSDMLRESGVSLTTFYRAVDWLRSCKAPLDFCHKDCLWRLGAGWILPIDAVPRSELVRAWSTVQRLREILEVDDVIAEVEAIVLENLGVAAE